MSIYDNRFTSTYNHVFTDLAGNIWNLFNFFTFLCVLYTCITFLLDQRTNDWPLIASPVPGLTIIGTYLYFVLSWGPKYMANRKPYKLEKLLIIYNFIQVLVSCYLFFEVNKLLFYDYIYNRKIKCVLFWKKKIAGHGRGLVNTIQLAMSASRFFRIQGSNAGKRVYNTAIVQTVLKINNYFCLNQEARGVYIYFLAKISELLDTVFFVLRKKDRQISFLHLYHHTVMPMISWGATKYYPGGHGTFIGKQSHRN